MGDDPQPPPQRELHLRSAHTITPGRVRWLWEGRIPVGEMTLLVGRGGVGKSTLIATLVAWITTGTMKGEHLGAPHDVLYVVNEDSLKYTVVPRLIAAGADLSRVHFAHITEGLESDRVSFPLDCERIKEAAVHYGAAAVVFDPLSSNLTAKKNDQDDMRRVMERLRRTVEASGAAGIGLAHTRKAMSTNLMDAIMGSSELGNVTRSVMGVMADPDEEGTIVLSQEKNNLGRLDVPSYRYRIRTCYLADGLEPIETGQIEWLGKTDQTVSGMLADGAASPFTTKHAVGEAEEFIRAYLTAEGGEALRGEVILAGQKDGHSRPTLDRAARRLKIASRASGKGASKLWCLLAF